MDVLWSSKKNGTWASLFKINVITKDTGCYLRQRI